MYRRHFKLSWFVSLVLVAILVGVFWEPSADLREVLFAGEPRERAVENLGQPEVKTLLDLDEALISGKILTPVPTPTSITAPVEFSSLDNSWTSQATEHIQSLVNAKRLERGLRTLSIVETLSTIAQSHSESMARSGRLGYKELRVQGFNCPRSGGGGQTVYQAYWSTPGRTLNPEDFASLAVEAWVNSPGHLENILEVSARRFGVGLALSDDGREIWATLYSC